MRRVSQRQGRNHLVGRKLSRYSNDRLTGCCVFDRDKPLFPSIGDFDVLVQRVRQLEEYIKTNGTLQLGQGTVPRIRSVERQSHFSELHPVLHQVPAKLLILRCYTLRSQRQPQRITAVPFTARTICRARTSESSLSDRPTKRCWRRKRVGLATTSKFPKSSSR